MGVVIDFQKYAENRKQAVKAREVQVADISELHAPHQWPAGAPDEHDVADIATVMTLEGKFRDSSLFALIPKEHDKYSILQFAPHVTVETMDSVKPIARMYASAEKVAEMFEPLGQPAAAKLGVHFARMALLSDNPGQSAQLYALGVKAVHVVVDSGLYAFGGSNVMEKYNAGDVAVEFKGGSVAYGPAGMMLPRVVPLDDDARIALTNAPMHIPDAPRGPIGPDSFTF